MQSLGDQVKQIREALGMTQQQLAARSGLAQNVIADIENGKRRNLTLPTIHKLAEGLNCQFVPQLSLQKNILELREEQGTRIAQKIISMTSGSSAIEIQLPSRESVEKQITELKGELLQKGNTALWQKI
ncbi:MAG: helix-turn-helix domain-containing protein [Candidatus Omnitrophica bacterium]|nr:helix-turn-helix domain-containing protein [Candidatus Omnitrophota bacterium]